MRSRPGSNPLAHVAGGVATLFLAAFLLVPLGVILGRGLAPGEEPLGAALLRTLTDPYYLGRIGFTLGQALLSTVLTVALGLPTALLLARYRFRGKRALTAAFTIPFVMPTVVAGIGFMALAGPRGVLGVDLRNSLAIVLLAHVFYNFSVVARLVASFLERVAPQLEEAASTLGAGRWRTLWRVTLPLALPATLAAAVLTFIFCFTSFGVILILAPAAQFATLEVEIYNLTARLLQLDAAAALVLVQLLLVLAASSVYTRLQARLAVPVAPGSAERRPTAGTQVLLGADLLLAGGLILAPLLALLVQAFTGPGGDFPSLATFGSLLEARQSLGFPGLWRALGNSLTFATLSTALALLVGFLFAYAVARGGWRVLDQASLLPLATSPVTLAFGYLLTFPLLVTTFWGIRWRTRCWRSPSWRARCCRRSGPYPRSSWRRRRCWGRALGGRCGASSCRSCARRCSRRRRSPSPSPWGSSAPPCCWCAPSTPPCPWPSTTGWGAPAPSTTVRLWRCLPC